MTREGRSHSFGLAQWRVDVVADGRFQPVREGLFNQQLGRTYRWRWLAHVAVVFGNPWGKP